MKQLKLTILGFVFISILSIGCYRVRTYSTGLPNEAYLEFVGKPSKYKNGVSVVLDDHTKFTAIVKKDYAEKPTGYVYSISKGTHHIKVSYAGQTLFEKDIFVSPQETKKIILP